MLRTGVIIVAGGSGRRMGSTLPKQFLLLRGIPVLAHTINTFARTIPDARIVVVLPAAYTAFWNDFAARFDVAAHTVAEGGRERFHSVRSGMAALRGDEELIAVQDAVRPLCTPELIRRVAAAAATHGAAIPVTEPVDSFRMTDGTDSRIIDRSRLRIVQTPQIFRAELLRKAYAAEYEPGFTDDASVVERCGQSVRLVEGERANLKITAPEDLAIAEALLEAREHENDTDADDL